MPRKCWLIVWLLVALPASAEEGDWRTIGKDRDGQRTALDYAYFKPGNPAEFLVRHDNLVCQSRYRMSACTSVELYRADCRQGKLEYRRAVMRDVKGNVVKTYQNHQVKMVYPAAGGYMETILLAACRRNKILLSETGLRPRAPMVTTLAPIADAARAAAESPDTTDALVRWAELIAPTSWGDTRQTWPDAQNFIALPQDSPSPEQVSP